MGISNSLTMSYLRATFDEQELSKKAPSSQYLHKWIFDFVGKKQTLTIFRINEKIKYLLEDFILVRTYEGTIDEKGESIDKMIPRLIDSQLEITEKNEVIFTPKQEYICWELKDKKISLLRQKDDLIYQIFDRTLNVSIQTSMDFTEFGYIRWNYSTESLPTITTTKVVKEKMDSLSKEIAEIEKEKYKNEQDLAAMKKEYDEISRSNSFSTQEQLDEVTLLNERQDLVRRMIALNQNLINSLKNEYNMSESIERFHICIEKSSLRCEKIKDQIENSEEKRLKKRLREEQNIYVVDDTYKTIDEKVSVLKNYKPEEKLEKIEGKGIEFSRFFLQPKWIRSKLDPTIIIDHKNWAITVINTDDMWPGHAVIIIESMEEGQYFMYKAHIGGDKTISGLPAKVILQKKYLAEDSSKLYGNFGKTETFSRPSYLVKLMIERIEWEKNMALNHCAQVYFSQNPIESPIRVQAFNTFEEMDLFKKENKPSLLIQRSYSINSKDQIEVRCKQDTCITWVMERLEIAEIKLGAESFEFFETPRKYTNPDSAGARYGVVDFIKKLFK